jgi:hypothetical protein
MGIFRGAEDSRAPLVRVGGPAQPNSAAVLAEIISARTCDGLGHEYVSVWMWGLGSYDGPPRINKIPGAESGT